MSPAVVDIKDLWVSLQHADILREVSLQIARGTFLGLIGPNGGGKTILLQTILGLVKPDKGSVKVFGHHPGHAKSRGLIGYLPQRAYADLAFPVSAFDVVMMGRYPRIGFWKRPGPEDRRRVLEKLEAVEMVHLRDRPIGHLSVDSRAQGSFYELLGKLKRALSLTVVLVSHDIGVIPYHTDEIACLNQKLYLHGKCPDVLDSEALGKVYGCEVEILIHGKIPHRVIGEHHD